MEMYVLSHIFLVKIAVGGLLSRACMLFLEICYAFQHTSYLAILQKVCHRPTSVPQPHAMCYCSQCDS